MHVSESGISCCYYSRYICVDILSQQFLYSCMYREYPIVAGLKKVTFCIACEVSAHRLLNMYKFDAKNYFYYVHRS